MRMTSNRGALSEIRVLEFGHYTAGPLTGMLLADQGADVVLVDRPGRRLDGTDVTFRRNKRSIALDLHDERDRSTARRLARSADVLIENFRPGAMAARGLGPDELLGGGTGLIYCSLPGFGADDPRAPVAGWEGVVTAAAAGYPPAGVEPGKQGAPTDAPPTFTAIPVASTFAALLAASSIVGALLARDRDGSGQRIEIPLHDAMFLALGTELLRVRGTARGFARNELVMGRYECADGRWIQIVANSGRFIHRLLDALDAPEWFADVRGYLRIEDRDEADRIRERLTARFRERDAEDWEQAINDAGTAAAVSRTTAAWLAHPQARASGAVVEGTPDDHASSVLRPGPLVQLTGTVDAAVGQSPRPDADREAIFNDPAWRVARTPSPSPVPGNTVRAGGASDPPLAGIRVLDLCIVLAGPTCGRTLAELGADVIKIDNPRRRANRLHREVNRGKRTILLDLATTEGLALFWRLLADTDVIVENFRAGVVQRLGIDYEHVRERRPDIVYASINAYGHDGPWAGRPGWEQVAQAASGMQERFGGDAPPALQPYPICDYGTGLAAAFGVVAAILQRARTGEGQRLRASLTQTATTLQATLFGEEGQAVARGPEALGSGPLHRLYRASDGWLFVGARGDQLGSLCDSVGVRDFEVGVDGTAQLSAALEARFVTASCDEWVRRLVEAGLGAQRVRSIEELAADPLAREQGLMLAREHPDVGVVECVGPGPRLMRTPVSAGRPAPPPGADGRAILDELGMASEYERLLKVGVIAEPTSA